MTSWKILVVKVVISPQFYSLNNVFDPDFSLKEIAENNPFNHLVMKNGFIFFD